MLLKKISLVNFRSYNNFEYTPCDNINIIYGNNAQGKTNLIEAIWLFTGNQSFRTHKYSELIKFETEFSRISIEFSDSQRSQNASIILANKRKVTLNSVPLSSISQLQSHFYAVVFSPSHLSLVKESPKNRRSFLDIAISEIKPQYYELLSNYEKIINQRNTYIKSGASEKSFYDLIDIYDLQLSKIGTVLSIYRSDYVKKLNIIARKIIKNVSRETELLDISYNSLIFEDINEYTEENQKKYYNKLKENIELDIKYGYTNVGVHRDDISILINGISVKNYGSQGQQRTVALVLKLAEATLLKKVTGENPIMLLDDVLSELDEYRQNYILNNLNDMQIFITCCEPTVISCLTNGKAVKIEKEI